MAQNGLYYEVNSIATLSASFCIASLKTAKTPSVSAARGRKDGGRRDANGTPSTEQSRRARSLAVFVINNVKVPLTVNMIRSGII
jgi:hypothetical protein